MKRFTVILIALSLAVSTVIAQSSLGKTDDLGRIAIAAIVPDEAGIPGGAQRSLQNRLMQIATLNGLGATENAAQFVMVPMISVISKDITPTAPPKVSLRIDVTLYIVDALTQNIYSQTSVEVRGIGNTDERAYTQAINGINPRQGQFRGFIEKGKEKIIEYYNSKCDVIISSAKALAGQKKYDEALFTLMSVPDVSRECYDKCMQVSMDVYQEYADQQCNESLSAAKSAWAGKDLSGVEKHLGNITPDMGCYDEVQQLIATVTAAVEAEGGTAWNFKMKKYDDSVDIEKMKIQAGKEVAQSWAYHGASANFDWGWLYPNAERKTPKPEPTPESKVEKVSPQPDKPAEQPTGPAKSYEPLENTTVFNKLSATVTQYNGDFKGNFTVLTDGKYEGTNSVVSWSDGGTYFVIDLGSVKQINGINFGAIGNQDVYLDCSLDGTNFSKFTHVLGKWGQSSKSAYIEIYSTNPSSKNYEPRIQLKPVKARYLKLYCPQGSKVSEIMPLGL